MTKKVRSAKGELVDFDLLKIKEQITSSPPPQDVKLRQDFIEKRIRRRLRKITPPAPKIENSKEVLVAPKLAGTETLFEQPKSDEIEPESTNSISKQRSRKPITKTEAPEE